MCDVWTRQSEPEMSTNQIKAMLKNARDHGFVSYTVWGGEPLLRSDIGEILSYAKTLSLTTSLITNGILLSRKVKELVGNLDYLIVSIDFVDSTHDDFRGVPGTLASTLRGINLIGNNCHVMVNSVINRYNYDRVEEIVRLAAKMGMSVVFTPMEIYSGYNEQYALLSGQREHAFRKLKALKEAGMPVNISKDYIDAMINRMPEYRCHAPKIFITVRPDGQIDSCKLLNFASLGNWNDGGFSSVFASKAYRNFKRIAESCHQCTANCVVEASLVYELKLRPTIGYLHQLVRQGG